MEQVDYLVISSSSIFDLKEKINIATTNGWQKFEGPFLKEDDLFGLRIVQLMRKEINYEEKQ